MKTNASRKSVSIMGQAEALPRAHGSGAPETSHVLAACSCPDGAPVAGDEPHAPRLQAPEPHPDQPRQLPLDQPVQLLCC
eukprot:10851898-Lingulodinium_polyedra.AAC.1